MDPVRRAYLDERDRRAATQPACCVDVEPPARVVGRTTIDDWREGRCAKGCHRVVVSGHFRTVYDLRTNSANPEWQGWRP